MTDDDVQPQQLDPDVFGSAPDGVCSRWVGTSPCGALAVSHVVWSYHSDGCLVNGLQCQEHSEEARRSWVYLGLHLYVPAICSHPEARWDSELDACSIPWASAEAVAEARATVAGTVRLPANLSEVS